MHQIQEIPRKKTSIFTIPSDEICLNSAAYRLRHKGRHTPIGNFRASCERLKTTMDEARCQRLCIGADTQPQTEAGSMNRIPSFSRLTRPCEFRMMSSASFPRHFGKLHGHGARYLVAHEDVYARRFAHCPDEPADVYVLVLKLHAFSGRIVRFFRPASRLAAGPPPPPAQATQVQPLRDPKRRRTRVHRARIVSQYPTPSLSSS